MSQCLDREAAVCARPCFYICMGERISLQILHLICAGGSCAAECCFLPWKARHRSFSLGFAMQPNKMP